MFKKYNEVCSQIGYTRDGLRKLMARDKSFPQPIKLGNTRQSPVYFEAEEIEEWIKLKKAESRKVTA